MKCPSSPFSISHFYFLFSIAIFHLPFSICHFLFAIPGVHRIEEMTNDKWQIENRKWKIDN